jgi:hypothetical protein
MGGFKLNGETSVFMRTRTHFLWLVLFSAVIDSFGFASHDVGETDLAPFFARTAGMRDNEALRGGVKDGTGNE